MRRARRQLLLTALAVATAPVLARADDSLELAIEQAARRADSFRTVDQARTWLGRMSRRLRHQVRNPFYRLELLRIIHREATRSRLAPELVMAVIQVESSFNRYAVSDVGARGLMQLMPFWMKEIGLPNDDLFNPAVNIRYGCMVLGDYLRRSEGNIDQALARYNGSISQRGARYASRVLTTMQDFLVG